MKNKTLDERLKMLEEMQKLFDEVEPEVEQLLKLFIKFRKVNDKINSLQEFYNAEWMDLYENVPAAERDKFKIMEQDALWNLITTYYRNMHRFLGENEPQITAEE